MSAVSFAGIRRWRDSQPLQWVEYTSQAFSQQASENLPIVIFLNADWDLNGQVVKQFAFENRNLKSIFRERAIVAFYADVTFTSPDEMAMLRRIDRHSTPVVVVYAKGASGDPVVLDGLVSAEEVLKALAPVPAVSGRQSGG